ncbi:MAG: M48 family metallopeptidase [Bacillota bacterium]
MERQTRSLIVSERSIQIEQRTIAYTLRRNRRAKRVTLRVDQDGLTMTVPWSFPQDQLEPFIRARREWVVTTLERFAKPASSIIEPAWTPADGVLILGKQRAILRSPSQPTIALVGESILMPERLAEDSSRAKAAIESWLKDLARQFLAERLAHHGLSMGVSPTRVTLRSQKTRWGSCSSQGCISLNWRLIMAPPAAIDYVLIHELAHLIEMNHSESFWKIVARHDPNYREHRRWLRENGSSLTLKRSQGL